MGPIAKKLAAALRKHKNQKVVDLAAFTVGKSQAGESAKTIATPKELSSLHPAHALYVYAQNIVSFLSEQITQLREMHRFAKVLGPAEETYMPGGPPMSPLTGSYFTCWAFFDACVGAAEETIGSCILDVGRILNLDDELLRIISLMQASRMGLFVRVGVDGENIVLRELLTDREVEAVNPTGYVGSEEEILLVRVLPPADPKSQEHVIFTTPYAIVRPGIAEWVEYLMRTTEKMGGRGDLGAYEKLMKYGPERNYWNEYIFEAYLNHSTDSIFLAGLPDVEGSRPHARKNW